MGVSGNFSDMSLCQKDTHKVVELPVLSVYCFQCIAKPMHCFAPSNSRIVMRIGASYSFSH